MQHIHKPKPYSPVPIEGPFQTQKRVDLVPRWFAMVCVAMLAMIFIGLLVFLHNLRNFHQELDRFERQQNQNEALTLERIQDSIATCSLDVVVCPGEPQGEPAVAGVASWLVYERQDTCAALLWPKGTRLRVTAGDRSIVCTRRDSGPYITGRVIDLNRAQFAQLADPRHGLIHVTVQPL